MEADFHSGADAPAGDDAAGVDHARAADPALRRDLGEAVDRHLAHAGLLQPIGLLAVGRGEAVEQAHPAVDPRAGAHRDEQRLLGQLADEGVQARVVDLGARAESAGNEKGVHVRTLGERIVRQHGEPRLRAHRAQRLGDEERVELGIEAPRHREHAVRRGEIDDLQVLAHVDAEAKARLLREGRHG